MLSDFAEKKETFFDLKKQNFSNSKKSHFFKGVNPYFCRVFIRHRRSENSPFIMKNSPTDVRQPVTIFFSDEEPLSKYSPVVLHLSPATRILNENPAFGQKCHFFLYLDLIKIRLEIMLSDFAEKKETFFDLKKQFFKVQKILKHRTFPKGRTHAFGQKMPIFWLFRFGQNVVSALFAI